VTTPFVCAYLHRCGLVFSLSFTLSFKLSNSGIILMFRATTLGYQTRTALVPSLACQRMTVNGGTQKENFMGHMSSVLSVPVERTMKGFKVSFRMETFATSLRGYLESQVQVQACQTVRTVPFCEYNTFPRSRVCFTEFLTCIFSFNHRIVFEAVGWMVEKGARIINMSLGGSEQSEAGRKMMMTAYDAGALVIAAAGNAGGSKFHYPASYSNVISVAAVDEDEDIATFSQYNSEVDIAAPGVEILSTVPPETGGVVLLTTTTVGAPGTYMKYSPNPQATIEGELVDCGDGGGICPKGSTSQKHICLIER